MSTLEEEIGEDERTGMNVAITFSIVKCDCGEERQAGTVCPSCGRGADEDDPRVVARRAVAAIAGAPPADDGDALPVEIDEVFGLFNGWMNGFMATFEAVAERLEDETDQATQTVLGEELHIPVSELDRLRQRIAATPRLRPAFRFWRIVDRLLALLDDMRTSYLEALAARTMAEAEAKAEAGQAALDHASAALNHFNRFTDVWQAIEEVPVGDEFADVLEGATAISKLQESGNIVEIDRRGRALAERITGKPTELPAGIGVVLLHLDIAAESLYDTDRFWSGAGEVYRLAAARPEALLSLFEDASWRRELAMLAVGIRDAGFELQAVSAASSNRRRQIKSLLGVGAHLFEQSAPPLLATVRSLQQRSAYARERSKEPNTLAHEVKQSSLGHLLIGIDAKIRDADAHGRVELTDDGINFTGTRGSLTTASDAELVDVILAGLESISLFYWGLMIAMIEAGADPVEIEKLAPAEIPLTDQVKYMLNLAGWQNVEVAIDDGHLEVRGERDEPSSLIVIGSLVPNIPAEVDTARFVRVGEDGEHVAEGRLGPFRAFSEEEDEELKENAFTCASVAWSIDGVPIMDSTQVRKISAVRALQAMQADRPVGARLRSLRGLLDHARAIDDQEMADAMSLALRAVRSDDRHALEAALVPLVEWGGREITPPAQAW